jgi:hypothetical protein
LLGIYFRVFLRVAPPTYGYVLAPTIPQERMQLRNGVLRALPTWLSFLPRAKSLTLTVIFHRSLISASVGNARTNGTHRRPHPISLSGSTPILVFIGRQAHISYPPSDARRLTGRAFRSTDPPHRCRSGCLYPATFAHVFSPYTRIQSSGDRRTLGTLVEKAVYDMLFALRDTRLQFVGTEMDKSWPDQVTLTTPAGFTAGCSRPRLVCLTLNPPPLSSGSGEATGDHQPAITDPTPFAAPFRKENGGWEFSVFFRCTVLTQ